MNLQGAIDSIVTSTICMVTFNFVILSTYYKREISVVAGGNNITLLQYVCEKMPWKSNQYHVKNHAPAPVCRSSHHTIITTRERTITNIHIISSTNITIFHTNNSNSGSLGPLWVMITIILLCITIYCHALPCIAMHPCDGVSLNLQYTWGWGGGAYTL